MCKPIDQLLDSLSANFSAYIDGRVEWGDLFDAIDSTIQAHDKSKLEPVQESKKERKKNGRKKQKS